MATIKFRIKDSESRTTSVREMANIRVRLNDFEISTGLKAHRKHWSKPFQKVKNNSETPYADEINTTLKELETYLFKEYAIAQTNDQLITQTWLSNSVKKFFNKATSDQSDADIFFVDRMKFYIDTQERDNNARTGKPRARRTIVDYKTKLKKIEVYQAKKGIKLKLIDINVKFHKEFIKFMKEDQLITNNNTLKGYTDIIKQVVIDAKRNGKKVNDEIESPQFTTPSQRTYDFAFKLNEIEKIYNHPFEPKSRLDKVRDWLIVGVWTGLRISDFLQLTKDDIEDDFITVTNQKTDIPVIIPLHDHVKSILKKWGDKFPETMSDQKFNEYVKEVCEEIGMKEIIEGAKMVEIGVKSGKKIFRKKYGKYPKHELVSSHICRRTFATIHYGKLDTLTIMRITGHKTEKQFIDYVKIPAKDYAERLKDLWNKQKEANINIYNDK